MTVVTNGYDIVICGAGTAGLACAIAAAEAGASVVVVEKDVEIGGTLHLSAGQMSAAGSRLHAADPDRLVLFSAGAAAAVTVVAAFFYSFAMATAVVLVSSVTNALGKVSLDAIIQREVPESLRASAFARS